MTGSRTWRIQELTGTPWHTCVTQRPRWAQLGYKDTVACLACFVARRMPLFLSSKGVLPESLIVAHRQACAVGNGGFDGSDPFVTHLQNASHCSCTIRGFCFPAGAATAWRRLGINGWSFHVASVAEKVRLGAFAKLQILSGMALPAHRVGQFMWLGKHGPDPKLYLLVVRLSRKFSLFFAYIRLSDSIHALTGLTCCASIALTMLLRP